MTNNTIWASPKVDGFTDAIYQFGHFSWWFEWERQTIFRQPQKWVSKIPQRWFTIVYSEFESCGSMLCGDSCRWLEHTIPLHKPSLEQPFGQNNQAVFVYCCGVEYLVESCSMHTAWLWAFLWQVQHFVWWAFSEHAEKGSFSARKKQLWPE